MKKSDLSLCGKFLIAMPGMGDHRFEKSVIYICAHSDEGAMGFIINQPMESPSVPDFLSQLEIITVDEKATLSDTTVSRTLHVGGPVEPGRGFVLHTEGYESDSTLEVSKGIYLTATLEILRAIATDKGPKQTLLMLGYSGWSSGQLEDEISSNGWLTVEADEDIIFAESDGSKYERSLKLLGVDMSLLSSDAGHA